MTIDTVIDARARDRAQEPFCTSYDAQTGERTELGYATFLNWLAKTANLLSDDIGLSPGDRLALDLPTHWTTAVITLAAWWCGLEVVLGKDPAAMARVLPQTASAPGSGPALAVGAGLGARLTGPRPAWADISFGEDVLACPDEFDAPEVDPGGPALTIDDHTWSVRELLGQVQAGDHDPQARLLCAEAPSRWLISGLLAAFAAGGSIVLAHGYDADGLERIAATERVSGRGDA